MLTTTENSKFVYDKLSEAVPVIVDASHTVANNAMDAITKLFNQRIESHYEVIFSYFPKSILNNMIKPLYLYAKSNPVLVCKVSVGIAATFAVIHIISKLGETRPLNATPKYMLRLERNGQTAGEHDVAQQPNLTGPAVQNLDGASIVLVTQLDDLKSQLDGLQTREQIIAWIITYQYLTKAGNGEDVTRGTVANGFVNTLRSLVALENVNMMGDAGFRALRDTLIELRNNDNLDILNSKSSSDMLTFQEIEIRQHNNNWNRYNIVEKAFTAAPKVARTGVHFFMSQAPRDFGKCVLGLSRAAATVGNAVVTLFSLGNG